MTETRLLDATLYGDPRYIRDTTKTTLPMSGVKQPDDYPVTYPYREHKYSINAPIRQVSCGPCDPHFSSQHLLDDDRFPSPPPELIKEHIYETPSFPLENLQSRDIRPHSVDGIARRPDYDDGRSNRTN